MSKLSHKELKEKIWTSLQESYPSRPRPGQFFKGQEAWNKGKPNLFKGMTYEEIGRGPSPLTGVPRPSWVREKISKGHLLRLGKSTPTEARDNGKTNIWKKFIKKRDNYTCQRCGVKQKDLPKTEDSVTDYLHCHHIKSWVDFPELRYDVNNGITLCEPCHKKEEGKGRLFPYRPYTVKPKRIAWNKGKTNVELFGEQKAAELKKKLSKAHLGHKPVVYIRTPETIAKMIETRKSRGYTTHNKGKTLLEEYSEEKAIEISNKHAEASRRTKNRLGTGKSSQLPQAV